MEDEESAFIKYFNEIAKRIKEQGSEVKHWYREITFSDALKKIKGNLEIEYKKLQMGTGKKLDIRRFLYYSIAYLQLTNGLRSTEAIKGLQLFLKRKEKVLKIIAGKSKLERLIIIPPLLFDYYDELKKYSDILDKINKRNYYNFIKNNLGINPHSFRYAFIDYMLSKGLTPEELVVYMGYSSFKHMINYYRIASAKDKIIQKIKEAIWENY
jgi:integrase